MDPRPMSGRREVGEGESGIRLALARCSYPCHTVSIGLGLSVVPLRAPPPATPGASVGPAFAKAGTPPELSIGLR